MIFWNSLTLAKPSKTILPNYTKTNLQTLHLAQPSSTATEAEAVVVDVVVAKNRVVVAETSLVVSATKALVPTLVVVDVGDVWRDRPSQAKHSS